MLWRSIDKTLRMGRIRRIQMPLPASNHRFRLSAVYYLRSEEGDPSMMVLMVVPGNEFRHQSARLLDRLEAIRKLGAVLEGFELRLRIRIVVRNMRTTVGLDHSQVRQEQRDGLARHRRSPVGMHRELTRGNVLLCERLLDKLLGQFLALLVSDHPADHIATVDIEHDIQMEIGPGRRALELGDVPTPELVDASGEQFGLDMVPGSTGAPGMGAVGRQQAIEGTA